jgi:hypothetical protein
MTNYFLFIFDILSYLFNKDKSEKLKTSTFNFLFANKQNKRIE